MLLGKMRLLQAQTAVPEDNSPRTKITGEKESFSCAEKKEKPIAAALSESFHHAESPRVRIASGKTGARTHIHTKPKVTSRSTSIAQTNQEFRHASRTF